MDEWVAGSKNRDRALGVHMQEGLQEQHVWVYPEWIEV